MVTRATVMGAFLVGGVVYFTQSYRQNAEAKNASDLIKNGHCEEGVSVLERMKNGGTLSPEYNDILNEAYVQMGLSYANSHNYGRAVDVLKKVSPKSKFYSKAQNLINRYSPRVHS
jgi:hypothetical protein